MDQDLKRIVNILRCPICSAQIDGGDAKVLYCAADREHYKLSMYENPIIVASEKIQFYDKDFLNLYKISKEYAEDGKLSFCTICLDKPGRAHSKNITIDFDPINFKVFSIEKAIDRIKNIFVFQ